MSVTRKYFQSRPFDYKFHPLFTRVDESGTVKSAFNEHDQSQATLVKLGYNVTKRLMMRLVRVTSSFVKSLEKDWESKNSHRAQPQQPQQSRLTLPYEMQLEILKNFDLKTFIEYCKTCDPSLTASVSRHIIKTYNIQYNDPDNLIYRHSKQKHENYVKTVGDKKYVKYLGILELYYSVYVLETLANMHSRTSSIPDLPNLKRLTLTGCHFKSIGNFKNLEELFTNRELKSIGKCPKLEELYGTCGFTDMSSMTFMSMKTLNIMCPSLTHLPLTPNLIVLECKNSPLLSVLPEYTDIIDIYVSGAALVTIPNYESARKLNFLNCTNLTSVSTSYPNLTFLNLYRCNVGRLPIAFPKLKELICYGCPLTNLPVAENLHRLDCSNTRVQVIENYPNLRTLHCSNTPVDRLSPTFDKLEYIFCERTSVEAIPEFPSLKKLRVGGHVKHIGRYDKLDTLRVVAGNLETFHTDYPSLVELQCNDNPRLVNLPIARKLEYLECDGCNVYTIPYYKKLISLSCQNNHISRIPHFKNLDYLDCRDNPIIVSELPTFKNMAPEDLQIGNY